MLAPGLLVRHGVAASHRVGRFLLRLGQERTRIQERGLIVDVGGQVCGGDTDAHYYLYITSIEKFFAALRMTRRGEGQAISACIS